jgi:formate-nitrite transporter family protein
VPNSGSIVSLIGTGTARWPLTHRSRPSAHPCSSGLRFCVAALRKYIPPHLIGMPAQSPEDDDQRTGAQLGLSRPSAKDIYVEVASNARDELKRSTLSLAISGFAGGIFMGLSGLGVAVASAQLGASPAALFIAQMFYPLGFLVVILGRAQLFTENTLYPVALSLAERKYHLHTLRLWATVLAANLCGTFSFALLAARTPALQPKILAELAHLGQASVQQASPSIFWSAVVAGWVIAMVAWLVSASHSITGSALVIWTLTFVIGLGHFAHCIAGSAEVLTTVLMHQAGWTSFARWLSLAVAGNVTGGVVIVTLLEYGQVIADRAGEQAILEEANKHRDEEEEGKS